MKRYWVAKYEKEASKKFAVKKQNLSKEIEALLGVWSSKHDKEEVKEIKRLFGCAKTQISTFSEAMRKLHKLGRNLMSIYLRSWMTFGDKPGRARKAFAALLCDYL